MFDCVPSELPELYWRYTRRDISTKLRLYLGERQAGFVQGYQSLTLVASQLFGEGDGKETSEAEVPQTAEELQASFSQVFGKG